jgi:hypothetical protein
MVINELRLFIRNTLRESLYDISIGKTTQNESVFNFKVDEFDYQVTFNLFQKDDRFYAFGFKAKHESEDNYQHDMLTNKNVYKVMETISKILGDFYNKRKEQIISDLKRFNVDEDRWNLLFKGFVFSLRSKDIKKNEQRLLLYKRYMSKYGFSVYEENGLFYITK